MEQSKDDQIRDAIMEVIHYGYRNPKGKYIHMTMQVVWQEVRDKVPCESQDITRELKYLVLHGWIDPKKMTTQNVLRTKFGPSNFTTEYYELSRQGVDLFEQSGKYSKKDLGWETKIPTVRIENSTINAPVTIGDNNIVNSYNTSNDIQKILNLIDARVGIDEKQKVELKKIIQEELEPILNNPNLKESKSFIDKIKSTGQTWIVPILTQMIAAYLIFHLGLTPVQVPPTQNSPTQTPPAIHSTYIA